MLTVAEICCCASGRFTLRALLGYLTFMSVTFWSFIFLAWLMYPSENSYSIMTHTFSFLGSHEEKHNPDWWWIFSIAMLFWCFSAMPVVLYIYRHFTRLTVWGARLGAALLLTGCVHIGLVGIFPDARGMVFGVARQSEVHKWVAIIAAAAFILGIGWHGLMLLGDLLIAALRGKPRRLAHRWLLPPYVFWLTVLATSSYFLIKWEFVYAGMKAAAQSSGVSIGSSWSEAMNTLYSFPLWENICIYTLFIFLVWFSGALAVRDGGGR